MPASHDRLVEIGREMLKKIGFLDEEIETNHKVGEYVVDLWAETKDFKIAVECGSCDILKLISLSNSCTAIIWIPYSR